MDETYTLSPDGAGCRLELAVEVRSRVPLLGIVLERLTIGPNTRRDFEASLASLKRHCETSA
jgi:hypothetical protein